MGFTLVTISCHWLQMLIMVISGPQSVLMRVGLLSNPSNWLAEFGAAVSYQSDEKDLGNSMVDLGNSSPRLTN